VTRPERSAGAAALIEALREEGALLSS
jgi:hypothetical protein